MPLPRPKKYENQAARQRAYQERVNAKLAEDKQLAAIARQIAEVAAARGLIHLLTPDAVSGASATLQFLENVQPSKVGASARRK